MATIITSECINCGACEPECPNTAIYASGAPWELNGESHPALAEDIYYISPQKCTECVGFFDHEACAAVCPVDCCIPDPNNVETHEPLLARARALHPEETIGDDAPSRFRKQEGAAPSQPGGALAAIKAAAQANAVAPAPAKSASAPQAPEAPKPAAAPEARAPSASAPPQAPQASAKPAAPAATAEKPAATPSSEPAPKATAPAQAPPKPAAPATPPPAKPAAPPSGATPQSGGTPPPGKPAPPAAKPAAPAAPAFAMALAPKDAGALPGPLGEKHFPGELEEDFESVLAKLDTSPPVTAPPRLQAALKLAEPILGAMPDSVKAHLEEAVGRGAGFSRARATIFNIILNFLLYPSLLTAFSVMVLGDSLFSLRTNGWILLGLLLAAAEGAWRLRDGILHGRPVSELTCRACWYGFALAPLGQMLAGGAPLRRRERRVAFEGYSSDLHEEKTERDRRYGTVYTVMEYANAYLVRLEMPRKIPASSLKRLWNLPDEMPDYDYDIALADGILTISASVRGETLRKLSYVSPAFPADFMTRIDFDRPVATFKHRMRAKILEIIVLKGAAAEVRRAA
ncbi:MAG TPA: 4Fe-4S dicluster domain-containing protein [Candidatus Binataceae bacterium]|nr:4Fe-4S dicluster domain-containing protein [Candidatus Binataceae bacterium]